MWRSVLALALLVAVAVAATCTCSDDSECCTLTHGYWRTHSKYATQGQGENQIPWATYTAQCAGVDYFDEDTTVAAYFLGASGARAADTFLEALQAPSAGGDVCVQAVLQWIAATLSRCRGACVDSTVEEALAALPSLISTHCYGQTQPSATRTLIGNYATTLDQYVMGNTGPGHCGGAVEPPTCPNNTCIGGCTRTQGYWSTHNAAARNAALRRPWPCQDAHETTILFGEVSWLEVLLTPPEGSACIIGGKQYVAARLNLCALGACLVPAAEQALDVARSIIEGYCSDYPLVGEGALPSTINDTLREELIDARTQLLDAASVLDAYNSGAGGFFGPGHCVDADDGGGGGGGGGGRGRPSIAIDDSIIPTVMGYVNKFGRGMRKMGDIDVATLIVASVALFLLVCIIIWKLYNSSRTMLPARDSMSSASRVRKPQYRNV